MGTRLRMYFRLVCWVVRVFCVCAVCFLFFFGGVFILLCDKASPLLSFCALVLLPMERIAPSASQYVRRITRNCCKCWSGSEGKACRIVVPTPKLGQIRIGCSITTTNNDTTHHQHDHLHHHHLQQQQQQPTTGEQRHREERAPGLLLPAPALPRRVPLRNRRRVPPPAVPVLRAPRRRLPRDHQRPGLPPGTSALLLSVVTPVAESGNVVIIRGNASVKAAFVGPSVGLLLSSATPWLHFGRCLS